MASFTKRGKSYRIRASAGYTVNGKQIQPSMTWTPEPGMTERQIEKELARQMVLFDEQHKGWVVNGHIKFEEFSRQWFAEYVVQLGKRTQENYHQFEERTYKAIGHLYLDKITPRHIRKFINKLSEPGVNQRSKEQGLAPKTIKNYLSFISDVFSYAISCDMIKNNPCTAVSPPSLRSGTEKTCYSVEQTQQFLDILVEAPLRWQVFFSLAIFGGYRREEICGFEFQDFNFKEHTLTVNRVSLYTPKDGIFTAPPKTRKSQRTLKLPPWIFQLVKALRTEQTMCQLAAGDNWYTSDRLFTKQDGTPMNPNYAYQWLQKFCKRNEIPFYGIHQFRHLNASLLINNHEDVRTVSAALGHSQTSTTLNIYAHAFQTAQAAASDALAERLPVKFG